MCDLKEDYGGFKSLQRFFSFYEFTLLNIAHVSNVEAPILLEKNSFILATWIL